MRLKFLIIILSLFFSTSYSQEFGEIKYDLKLQAEHKDTLQSIGERLTGKWKYLGKRNNGILTDTLFARFWNNKKTYGVVENGIVYEIDDGIRKKTDYYYEITYRFKTSKGFYSRERRYRNKDIVEKSSDQPIPRLIFYKNNFGILFTGMAGHNFEKINELSADMLILESGKEYLKI